MCNHLWRRLRTACITVCTAAHKTVMYYSLHSKCDLHANFMHATCPDWMAFFHGAGCSAGYGGPDCGKCIGDSFQPLKNNLNRLPCTPCPVGFAANKAKTQCPGEYPTKPALMDSMSPSVVCGWLVKEWQLCIAQVCYAGSMVQDCTAWLKSRHAWRSSKHSKSGLLLITTGYVCCASQVLCCDSLNF